jgi:hypothetical protein
LRVVGNVISRCWVREWGALSRMQLLSDPSTASVYTRVLLRPLYFELNESPYMGDPVNHQLTYRPETSASEAPRQSSAVTGVFRRDMEKQIAGGSLSCRVCFELDGSARQGAGDHGVFEENDCATGHMGLEDSLVGGRIQSNLSQGGWAL